jgi:hypothetical protein
MSLKNLFATACIVALPNIAISASLPYTEVELQIGGGWSPFDFNKTIEGGAWLDVFNNGKRVAFTFSIGEGDSALLQVTDGIVIGDAFQVFKGSTEREVVGSTSVSPLGFDYVTERAAYDKLKADLMADLVDENGDGVLTPSEVRASMPEDIFAARQEEVLAAKNVLQGKLNALPEVEDKSGFNGEDNPEKYWSYAFNDPRWSSGSFFLGEGDYFITGEASQPLKHGTGAVRLVAPVPVPASVMFLLTAFGGCFAFSQYRSRKISGVA